MREQEQKQNATNGIIDADTESEAPIRLASSKGRQCRFESLLFDSIRGLCIAPAHTRARSRSNLSYTYSLSFLVCHFRGTKEPSSRGAFELRPRFG